MKLKFWLLTIALIISCNVTVFAENFDRLGGKDRYETAALINNQMESETLILVSGNDFADALSASSLVSYYNGEIHLINKELDSNTIESLKNNKFKKAIIVGGTGVIPSSVEDELILQLGSENVERLGGKDRYETSELVTQKVLQVNYSVDTVFIATGKDFADALSVSPIAAQFGYPIILTPGDYLGKSALSTLDNVNTCYKIGGPTIVSDNIDKAINNGSLTIKRLYGKNRYKTNKAVIDEFYLYAFNYKTVYVASGLDYPDALSGSDLAGKNKAPIIFVSDTVEPSSQYLFNLFPNSSLIALGGEAVVSNDTMKTLIENSKDKEMIFRYNNEVTLPSGSTMPSAEDIKLVAIDKEGNDCTNTFIPIKGDTVEIDGVVVGTMDFSVTIDGIDFFGHVSFRIK